MIFSSDVLNAIKGELGDVITQVPLAVGQIFDANRFTNLIVPNVPVVCIDNNWQVSTIKQCDQGFVLPQEAGKYLFLGPVVSSALGYVYVSSSYKQLLRVGYQSMFNGNVNINNKMYTNVFLTANHNFNSTIFSFSPITSNMLDVVPDVTNVLSYLSELTDVDVRIYSNISWYTNFFQQAIYDCWQTAFPPLSFLPRLATVISDYSVNLIYAKSLYEKELTYFDAAISSLKNELKE